MRQPRECSQESAPQSVPRESPTVRRIRQFVSEGKQCCHRACLGRFWESFRDDVQRFGEDVASCSHEAKEAALLMNLRAQRYTGPSRRTGSPRQRTRVA